MRSFLFFVILTSVVLGSQYEKNVYNKWINYQKKFNHFNDQTNRFEIFKENLKKIDEHNIRYDKGLETYSMGVNQFTALSEEEFLNYLRQNSYDIPNENYPRSNYSLRDYPDAIDWREKGAVTPVKMLQKCSESHYAFATAALLEAQYQITTGKLVNISVQNLIDCVQPNETQCTGDVIESLTFLTFQGIESEDDYPNDGKPNRCRYDRTKALLSTTGPNILEPDERIIAQEIAFNGPVILAIKISAKLNNYLNGIFSDDDCNNPNYPSWFMLAVGYGTENGVDYYILKNNWGPGWGENGYLRLARNKNNMCGVTNYAVNCKIVPPVDS